ncbi:MAG: helix-turn-helix domain-containing protein [Candidatus Nanoarchaeia archaeon]|nr:helix-turn-helix domain-containing protein [Candidatus Nanoarchaeia archaeon]MDD5741085.1 helix-turn-helix domain-containing protein [Candidatus Nanoarchaeia archaeon]
MDTKALEAVGFTKGEVKVYLSLLKLGETTTGRIIEKSKITGSKVYEILNKLIEKGLASYIIKEKTKYFQATSPRRLLDYVNKKQEEFIDEKKEIEHILPELELIQKTKQKIQSSQIFEGYEGVKTVFSLILDSLKPSEEYYAFSLGEELRNENIMLFLQNYHIKRIAKRIKVKIIANLSEKSLFKGLYRLKGLEVRYYKDSVPLGVFIFKDYIATFTFKEKPTCFLIKSEQISNSYKNFFESLWKLAKR